MKVLVLGLPRTGTQSLADALIELGISLVYHMREVGKNGHEDLWIYFSRICTFDHSTRLYHTERSPPRKFAARLTDSPQGVADYPAAIFTNELAKAYPEAAIILTTRSQDSWYDSMVNTLWHQYTNFTSNKKTSMRFLATRYHTHCCGNDFPAHGLLHFQKHNVLVRELGMGRRFLEHDVKMGWGPLCQFLGVPIPAHVSKE